MVIVVIVNSATSQLTFQSDRSLSIPGSLMQPVTNLCLDFLPKRFTKSAAKNLVALSFHICSKELYNYKPHCTARWVCSRCIAVIHIDFLSWSNMCDTSNSFFEISYLLCAKGLHNNAFHNNNEINSLNQSTLIHLLLCNTLWN